MQQGRPKAAKNKLKKKIRGNSLAVQWLGLGAFTAEGPGSIPGWGTKIPQAVWCRQKKKKIGLFKIKTQEIYQNE